MIIEYHTSDNKTEEIKTEDMGYALEKLYFLKKERETGAVIWRSKDDSYYKIVGDISLKV